MDKWIVFAIIFVAAGLISIFLPWDNIMPDYLFSNPENDKIAGYIYGITTPFFGLATVILLWRTYQKQSQQLENEKLGTEIQRFENVFFNLIDSHNKLIEGMDIRSSKDKTIVLDVKRDCFKRMYKRLVREYDTKKISLNRDLTFDEIIEVFTSVQDFYKADLHNYFRFAYRVLKFVKEKKVLNEDEKYEYIALFRGLFGPYELILLFYNCQSRFGKEKFKLLIEEFSFLKNLDDKLLLGSGFIEKYHEVAYGDWNKKPRKVNLQNWKEEREQERKAALKAATPVLP